MKSTRNEVYEALDSERDYQEEHGPEIIGEVIETGTLSVGDEILLMEEYLLRARKAWTDAASPELEALKIVRKVGGIAVRCMEVYGAISRGK